MVCLVMLMFLTAASEILHAHSMFPRFYCLSWFVFPHKTMSGLTPPPIPFSYLLLLLLFLLLCEEGVNPPDLGEHAAVRQTEAEAEEPEAELQEGGTAGREERDERLFVRTCESAGAGAVCQLLHELLLVYSVCCTLLFRVCLFLAVSIVLLCSLGSLYGLFVIFRFQGTVTIFLFKKSVFNR